MSAQTKTKALQRLDLPIEALVKNAKNPNKMSARAFDLLVDNLEKTGLTDPILVTPAEGGKYRIVGGHHRFDAAAYLGFETVPCTVIDDPEFDEEAEAFQLVRMNVIRGKMDPQAFYNLYVGMSEKYSDAVMQDAFGFAEEAEFKKLIEQTAKALPDKHLQDKFKEAAKEIKTIDGLSKLLNEMFTKYGDTLPFGYMIFDYNNQRSMWLRIENKTMKALDLIGDMCVEKERTVDDLVGGILQAIAKCEFKEHIDKVVASTPHVVVPKNLSLAPTKDNLDNLAAL
jgi:hypothetical protein